MSFLLKIVEGPMRGAEIALVEGLRVSVGSGDDCDIVLADGSLPAHAFELDVTATSVTLVRGDETQTLTPFEVVDVGTTAFAVGPAEGEWPENLARVARARPVADATGAKPGEPAADATGAKPGELAADATSAKPGAATEKTADRVTGAKPSSGEGGARPDEAGASPASRARRRGRGFGCLAVVVLMLLLAGLLFFFWPRVRAACPAAETARGAVVEQSLHAWDWAKGLCREIHARCAKPAPVASAPGPSLAEIAAQYALTLTERDGAPLLTGNVRRRTERLAIRSLALADSPNVRFDLTDDESLKAAADELLFVVTEGALKAVAASNRVVTLTGRIPTSAALEKAVRALNADVKGIARLVTDGVSVGGPLPTATADEPATAPKRRVAKPSAPDYPIAGILTAPYPCVVLRNGTRLTEGASLGTAVLVTIAADKLTLKDGGSVIEWKP